MTGERLAGGDLTEVVRVGDTVRRETGFWTPAVHALLRHFETRELAGVPRVLGVEDGREILSFLPGKTVTLPHGDWSRTDEALAEIGKMLRALHDASLDFVAPAGARWRRWIGAPDGDVVCHTDVTPQNVVFDGGRVSGLIDWDFAAPAPRLFDVASAAKHWAPLMAPERALSEGWPVVPRGPRLRLLCDAYGLSRDERSGVLDMCLLKQQTGYASHEAWAAAGDPGFARMWREGSGPRMAADMAWLRAHWTELEGALR